MINNLILQADGSILISGELSRIENVVTNGVTRIDTIGGQDRGFLTPVMGPNDSVSAIARDKTGNIIIGGTFITETSSTQHYLVGLSLDGVLDDSFESDYPDGNILSLLVQSDDRILVGGEYTSLKGSGQHALARLNADSSLDTSFNTQFHPSSRIHSLIQQSDGRILVGGAFMEGSDSNVHQNLARLNPDGSSDPNFARAVDDWVFSLLQQADGEILLGGVFKKIDDAEQKYLARLDENGVLDTSFAPDMGLLGWVYTMAQQHDGKILIGGEFTSIGGVDRNHIARMNLDGSLDTGFDPGLGANDSVKVIKIEADGRILIGGEFTSYDGVARRHMARLDSNGSLDHSFGDERT